MAKEKNFELLFKLNALEIEYGNEKELRNQDVEVEDFMHNTTLGYKPIEEFNVLVLSKYHNKIFSEEKDKTKRIFAFYKEHKNIAVIYTQGFIYHEQIEEKIKPLYIARTHLVYERFMEVVDNDLRGENVNKYIHASLMSIFDEGVLIKGKAGIGKSELCLALLNRGHYLIADDAINITYQYGKLVGFPATKLGSFIEVRGVGVINAKRTFGVQHISPYHHIDFIIELKEYDKKAANVDRLGTNLKTETILGVEVPKIIIYLSPGKSIVDIIETAIVNEKEKKYENYNATEDFLKKLKEK